MKVCKYHQAISKRMYHGQRVEPKSGEIGMMRVAYVEKIHVLDGYHHFHIFPI